MIDFKGRIFVFLLSGILVLSCSAAADNFPTGNWKELNKKLPSWPAPKTLRVVRENTGNNYLQLTIVALQGLVNRQAPDGNMVYLEMDMFPDRDWRKYYKSRLDLKVVRTSVGKLLDWARANAKIQHYIVIDPYKSKENIDKGHTCTINIACTISGIVGNAVPVHPDYIPMLRAHGYTLLPDSNRSALGPKGNELSTPGAFDLRNQWESSNPNAPWGSRRDAYRWALDTLLPLCDHHAITINGGNEIIYEEPHLPEYFAPWINDYSIGTRGFHYYFDPNSNPPQEEEGFINWTDYDRDLYNELLDRVGPFTMVRGWHLNEDEHMPLVSQRRCMHAGSVQMANASVHRAVSPLFEGPFEQRSADPGQVNLDADKVYLTFTFTDGDQFAVVYWFYQHWNEQGQPVRLWDDPARGKIPINWTMNGLMHDFGRGILRWFYDNASEYDYFTADLPVGYAFFCEYFFGGKLKKYHSFADAYINRTGMNIASFVDSFLHINDPTVEMRVRDLTRATAIREGYCGGIDYQGIHWSDADPLKPYIRNTYAAGVTDFRTQSGREVAGIIREMADRLPWRPLFMHITWMNWAQTPNDMYDCIKYLEKKCPGQYELVTLPQFAALAKEAKRTGQYPLEFYPHHGWHWGQEAPYLWADAGSTSSREGKRKNTWRASSGDNFFVYKFNVAPSKKASVTVTISGKAYRMDASKNNETWEMAVISGKSRKKQKVTADLTPFINAKGSFYLRFAGETRLWHLAIDY